MIRFGLVWRGALCCAMLLSGVQGIHAKNAARGRTYRSDRILIVPKAGTSPSQLEAWNHAHQVHTLRVHAGGPKLHLVGPSSGGSVEALVAAYQASGLVELAEPDYILSAYDDANDPAYLDGSDWALSNTGQNGGTAGADIGITSAWSRVTGSNDVIVAVVDTGIRYTHEDLAAHMWVNTAEIAQNGVDDDGDGIVDDVHGMNAITGTGDPFDDVGHGTHVAGIIGAVANNGKGGRGVAPHVRLMALKFMDANGEGATSDAIVCIDYARTHGAKVISASWGGTGSSTALRRAIDRARSAGIIFVAAAGNDSLNTDSRPDYPSSYPLDNIMSVAATDRNDALASFSNYGAASVDLGAPGVDILSSWNTSDTAYFSASGTSMATPFVSGAVALLEAQFPDKSYTEIIQAVLSSADPIPSLAGKVRSGGRLNVGHAFAVFAPVSATGATLTLTPAALSSGLSLRVTGAPGAGYVIEQSSDLSNWTQFFSGSADASGVLRHDLAVGSGKQRYYRARVE